MVQRHLQYEASQRSLGCILPEAITLCCMLICAEDLGQANKYACVDCSIAPEPDIASGGLSGWIHIELLACLHSFRDGPELE